MISLIGHLHLKATQVGFLQLVLAFGIMSLAESSPASSLVETLVPFPRLFKQPKRERSLLFLLTT